MTINEYQKLAMTTLNKEMSKNQLTDQKRANETGSMPGETAWSLLFILLYNYRLFLHRIRFLLLDNRLAFQK